MALEKIRIAGRDFSLAFTLDALAALEDSIRDFDLSRISDYAHSPRGLGDLVYCLAQQGELLEGRELDVSRAWIGSHLSPSPVKAAKIQVAVLNALAAGLKMETEDDSAQGETDVVLEEIKKNDPPAT